MCVIAFSPKGVDIPSVEEIKSMWATNPDGAGYAYVGRGGKVFYHKGFMKLEELLEELSDPERFKDTNFAIHFRIGTSGENDRATCHPFPVSTNFGELRKFDGVDDAVVFHNGIIGEGGIINKVASDTQDFVVAMTPLLKKYNKSKARDYYLSKLLGGNKLLVLYKNNAFKKYGDWKNKGGIWYSNLNHDGYYSLGGEYYGEYWRDWYEDFYRDKDIDKAEEEEEKKQLELEETYATTEEYNDKALELWADIIKKEYAFITPKELAMLKKISDDYDASTMELGGYTLGYDSKQSLVWLEYAPEDEEIKKAIPY